MEMKISEALANSCRRSPERLAWLEELTNVIHELEDRWAPMLDAPSKVNVRRDQ
jgi:hypothetical protein